MKYSLNERKVITKGDYWIAPNATVIGSVVLENNVSIWFNVVVRGDNDAAIILGHPSPGAFIPHPHFLRTQTTPGRGAPDMLISLRHSGMSPLRAATQAALARRAARVSSTGGHPSHGLAAAIRARWRAWRRRSAAQVTLRCVRWCRDQGLRHDRKRRTRKSGRFRRRLWAVARSRARGSRGWVPSHCA